MENSLQKCDKTYKKSLEKCERRKEMKEEIRSIGLIAIVIFLFGIIIGFTFMYQLRVQAEKRCEVLQEEVNLLKEVIVKEK